MIAARTSRPETNSSKSSDCTWLIAVFGWHLCSEVVGSYRWISFHVTHSATSSGRPVPLAEPGKCNGAIHFQYLSRCAGPAIPSRTIVGSGTCPVSLHELRGATAPASPRHSPGTPYLQGTAGVPLILARCWQAAQAFSTQHVPRPYSIDSSIRTCFDRAFHFFAALCNSPLPASTDFSPFSRFLFFFFLSELVLSFQGSQGFHTFRYLILLLASDFPFCFPSRGSTKQQGPRRSFDLIPLRRASRGSACPAYKVHLSFYEPQIISHFRVGHYHRTTSPTAAATSFF